MVRSFAEGAIASLLCPISDFVRPTFAIAATVVEQHDGAAGLARFLADASLSDFRHYTGDPRTVNPDFVEALGRLSPAERDPILTTMFAAESRGGLAPSVAERVRLASAGFGPR